MRQNLALVVSTPAGVAQATPQSTTWTMTDSQLLSLEVQIPGGHAGLTGIMFLKDGTQLLPWTLGTWIVGDNRIALYTLDYPMQVKGLVVQTYNTGFYPHKHYLRAEVETLPPVEAVAPGQHLALALPARYGGV